MILRRQILANNIWEKAEHISHISDALAKMQLDHVVAAAVADAPISPPLRCARPETVTPHCHN